MARVLIVDDDRTTVRLLQTLLQLDGFQVSTAARGDEVIAVAEKDRPDLILMDYHLADMDGIQLIQIVRRHPSFGTLPIVVASGLNVEKDSKAAGANEFVMKPFDPAYLPKLFNTLIDGESAAKSD